MKRFIFSVDCVSNGLHGQILSFGAVVYDRKYKKITDARSAGISLQGLKLDSWVVQHVVPHHPPVSEDIYKDFMEFRRFWKTNELMEVGHVIWPVEARFYSELVTKGYIDQWQGPFPLLDVASMLQMINRDPCSIDAYLKDKKITVEGKEHDPFHNAHGAALVCDYLLPTYDNKEEPQ